LLRLLFLISHLLLFKVWFDIIVAGVEAALEAIPHEMMVNA